MIEVTPYMNRHSILFKINIAFALSFAILLSLFILARQIISHDETFYLLRQVIIVAKTGSILKNKFAGATLIKDKKKLQTVLKNGSIIFKKKMMLLNNRNIILLNFNGYRYAYMQSKSGDILIEGTGDSNPQRILLLAYIGLNSILAFLYISIFRSIYPLGKFRKNMEDFKEGNIDIDLEEYIKRKDEIGFIAKEFREAMNNIKKNIDTRVWFIRNVAHELKTPVTKGKIALELLENDNNKKIIFYNIFTRLESLINELFITEKISITDVKLNISLFKLNNLIDKAKSLLFIENLKIYMQADADYNIKVDSELFIIALKNLLDNGIKFSDDKSVTVKIEKSVISFISKGARPTISEDLISEPFLKDKALKNKDGFGLGLYITKQILEKHGLNIKYNYEDGKNTFFINFAKAV